MEKIDALRKAGETTDDSAGADTAIDLRRLLDGLARMQPSLVRLSDDLSASAPPAIPAAVRVAATSEKPA
jgi:hypothetical protein